MSEALFAWCWFVAGAFAGVALMVCVVWWMEGRR